MLLNLIWMLFNGVCIIFLLFFMIVWNEIKNINLLDIVDDNWLKKLFFVVKIIVLLLIKNIYFDWFI